MTAQEGISRRSEWRSEKSWPEAEREWRRSRRLNQNPENERLLEEDYLHSRVVAWAGAAAMVKEGAYELLGTTPAGVYFLND